MDSLNLKFCYLANALLDSCTDNSLKFPIFSALLLCQKRILPNTSMSLWTKYSVTPPYICASLISICLSFFSSMATNAQISWSSTFSLSISSCLLSPLLSLSSFPLLSPYTLVPDCLFLLTVQSQFKPYHLQNLPLQSPFATSIPAPPASLPPQSSPNTLLPQNSRSI